MCEKCLKRVEEMDPKFIQILTDLEAEYRALEVKIGAVIRDLTKSPTVEECIEDARAKGMPESDEATQRAFIQSTDNATGMSMLVGAYSVLRLKDHSDAMYFMDIFQNGIAHGFNNGRALNWYNKKKKH